MGNTIKTFKISYVFLPVLIGLVVVSWLFYRDFNPELFSGLHFSWRMCGGILLAFLFIFGRDFGAMARLRWLSDDTLTWRQVFNVNMRLWAGEVSLFYFSIKKGLMPEKVRH